MPRRPTSSMGPALALLRFGQQTGCAGADACGALAQAVDGQARARSGDSTPSVALTALVLRK